MLIDYEVSLDLGSFTPNKSKFYLIRQIENILGGLHFGLCGFSYPQYKG